MPHITDHTTATLQFLKRDPLWDIEKPYELDFTISDKERQSHPAMDIPRTNAKYDYIEDVRIEDIRGGKSQLTFERNGLELVPFECGLNEEDFNHRDVIISKYMPAVVDLLARKFSPVRIQIWDYVVRTQDTMFPKATGDTYSDGPPATLAHIDTTQHSAGSIIHNLDPNDSTGLKKMHHKIINVWKPIRGPVEDGPIAFADRSTVESDDLREIDIVYEPSKTLESFLLHHSPRQKWYYISNQQPNEAWIFEQSDSRDPDTGVPHVAFQEPTWRERGRWKTPSSLTSRLLKILGSSASPILESDCQSTLHALREFIELEEDIQPLFAVARGEILWSEFQGHKSILSKSLEHLFGIIVENADIICVTPALSEQKPFKGWKNKVAKGIAIDEAANMGRPDLLCVWGNTFSPCTLAGDEKQLQTAVMMDGNKDNANQFLNRHSVEGKLSALGFIKEIGWPIHRLKVQHRMAIGQFDMSIREFYDVPFRYGDGCA